MASKRDGSGGGVTRRRFLATGAAVTMPALSGCLESGFGKLVDVLTWPAEVLDVFASPDYTVSFAAERDREVFESVEVGYFVDGLLVEKIGVDVGLSDGSPVVDYVVGYVEGEQEDVRRTPTGVSRTELEFTPIPDSFEVAAIQGGDEEYVDGEAAVVDGTVLERVEVDVTEHPPGGDE